MNTPQIKFTRADYINGKCSHREYFAQFVNDYVRKLVQSKISLERLKASKDQEYFNDIPLSFWDSFWLCRTANNGLYITPPGFVQDVIKLTGEGNSASTGTCILKEAARQLVEQSTK